MNQEEKYHLLNILHERRNGLMTIINLTQHSATNEQIEAGVVNQPTEFDQQQLTSLLTFTSIPTKEEIGRRAKAIAELAVGYEAALIGGAPYLMGALENALKDIGVKPLYSFSERVSVEKPGSDGSVVKTNVFKHVSFIEV